MVSTPTIGFVGIGQIGFPIATTLLEAGHQVVAHDLRDEALERFEARGGTTAADPAAVGRLADAVHVAVVTDEQVESVLEGTDGVFAGFEATGDGGIVAVHTTVVPGTVRDRAAAAPDGVDVLDVAVSGGFPRAAEGDLTLMVGGEPSVVDRHRPVLEAIGREIHHMGPVGSGMATKLLNNAILHAQEAATFEAVAFGRDLGLEESQLVSVFAQGTATNSAVQRWDYVTGEYFATHPRGPMGGVENTRKNLSQYLKMAAEADHDVPMAGLASQLAPRWKRHYAERVERG